MLWSYDVDEVTRKEIMGGEFLLEGNPDITDSSIHLSDGSISADVLERRGLRMECAVKNSSAAEGYIDLPLIGYYGYAARDGQGSRLAVSTAEDSRLRISIPSGFDGTVLVDFKGSLLWKAASLISLLSILALLCMPFYRERISKYIKKTGIE